MQFTLFTAALLSATAQASLYPRQNQPLVCGATSTATYKVAQGDTLLSIAAKKEFKSGACDIAKLNGISNPSFIKVGMQLTIPVKCTNPDNKSCVNTPTQTNTCVVGPPSSYDVRSGDSISSIAALFNISTSSLTDRNPSVDPNTISVGRILYVPICPDTECVFATYKIKSGDTFGDLASSHGSTTGQVLAANIGVDPTTLQVGQSVVLPQQCQKLISTVGAPNTKDGW